MRVRLYPGSTYKTYILGRQPREKRYNLSMIWFPFDNSELYRSLNRGNIELIVTTRA